ncbi:MAG: hypothetical protein IT453_21980 [Planctomycetes bacterium]|nr:hypothetical protein [Planctomycetota bacterium]
MERSESGRASAEPSRRTPWLVFALALVWLSIGAGRRALWQDEAATALLGKSLVEHGRPLAWDGKNLVTMDDFRAGEEAAIGAAMKSVETAIPYLVARGDFAADTTWIGHPWGSFLLAGVAHTLGGTDEFVLRLPFLICGAAALALLFAALARRVGTVPAWLAVAVLAFDAFWFVHVRQCRYYAPSSCFALATFVAYLRWREGARFGAAVFVAVAFAWFQFDFGSPFAALAVFAVDALVIDRKRALASLATFAVLGLLYLPSVLYFDLVDRLRPTDTPLEVRAGGLAFFTNQYVLPFTLAAAALALVVFSKRAEAPTRRLVALALAVVFAELAWMVRASPYPFLRYVIAFAPLGALVTACVAWEAGRRWLPRRAGVLATGLCALAVVSPLFAAPLSRALSADFDDLCAPGRFVRSELDVLASELFRSVPDPNRAVVDSLRGQLRDGDEILANYEDLPLAFYLDVPVRGGVAGFRVEAATPARWVVLRRTVGWVHWPAYERALAAARYQRGSLDAPDIPWGNNPDPSAHWSRIPFPVAPLTLLRRAD